MRRTRMRLVTVKPKLPRRSHCSANLRRVDAICMRRDDLGTPQSAVRSSASGLKPAPTSDVVVPERLRAILVRRSLVSATGNRLCRCGRTELAHSNTLWVRDHEGNYCQLRTRLAVMHCRYREAMSFRSSIPANVLRFSRDRICMRATLSAGDRQCGAEARHPLVGPMEVVDTRPSARRSYRMPLYSATVPSSEDVGRTEDEIMRAETICVDIGGCSPRASQ